MAADCVVAVELKHTFDRITPASKTCSPVAATVTWLYGRVDEVHLRLLHHGRTHDCFLGEPCGYILKIQEACCGDSSIVEEARLAASELGQCGTTVLGCVAMEWGGEELSVLVKEHVEKDFAAFFREMTQRPWAEGGLSEAVAVISAFFSLLCKVAGDLQFCVSDLGWKSLGVTMDGAVVLLDLEKCEYGPQQGPDKRWKNGVEVWMNDFAAFAESLPAFSPWRAPMRMLADMTADWWPNYHQQLPSADDIDGNLSVACSSAVLGNCWDIWGATRDYWTHGMEPICWDRFGFCVRRGGMVVMNAFQGGGVLRRWVVVVGFPHYHLSWSGGWRGGPDLIVHLEGGNYTRLRDLCTVRAVRHWVSVWLAAVRRRSGKRCASKVMRRRCMGARDVEALVQSFL